MNIRKFITPERIGKTSCLVVWDYSAGQLQRVRCLQCGTTFRRGIAAWTFAIGRAVMGHVCPGCLTPTERAKLEEARAK